MSSSRLLLRSPALRAVEADACHTLPPHTLMWRAARSAARLIQARWPGRPVTLLCGPGNNGGDGFIVAALLHQAGVDVRVWALPAPNGRPADAQQAWTDLPPGLVQPGHPVAWQARDDGPPSLVVDALFGIGLTRTLDPIAHRWIDWANDQPGDILALDVPSGLDADRGGAQTTCIQASCTLTFIADKPGLHTRAGPDHAGEIIVDPLDLLPLLPSLLPSADVGSLVARDDNPALFASRRQDSHKGSYGTVALLAGARGMTGAALLASRAALLLGAGKVFAVLAEPAPLSLACDPQHPELMLRDADDMLAHAEKLGVTTWVAGCGLGDTPEAANWLQRLLALQPAAPLVLDADALTMLAGSASLQQALAARPGPRVLTPHPLEAARLLACNTDDIQHDRIEAARRISARYGVWTVLKGAGTVMTCPRGTWRINGSGNPGLATAGTGDVLAGMIGALLAQALTPEQAVTGAVWLHGAAADDLVARGTGPIGLTASEIANAARGLRNRPL